MLHYLVLVLSLSMGVALDYWWLFWLSMELSLWVMISFIFETINSLQSFIFWQTVGSLFFILLFILMKSKLWMIALLFKMSLPPFHLWFMIYLTKVNWMFFLLFIYATKVPYIYILSNLWCEMFSYTLMVFPLVTYLYFWVCINFKYLFWIISIAEYPWSYFSSKSTYLMTTYVILTILMMIILMSSNLNQIFMLLIFYMMGLPPFSLFHVKMMIISYMSQFKMYCFLIFSMSNMIYIWLMIFMKWFMASLKINLNSNCTKFLFMLLNFAWLIF